MLLWAYESVSAHKVRYVTTQITWNDNNEEKDVTIPNKMFHMIRSCASIKQVQTNKPSINQWCQELEGIKYFYTLCAAVTLNTEVLRLETVRNCCAMLYPKSYFLRGVYNNIVPQLYLILSTKHSWLREIFARVKLTWISERVFESTFKLPKKIKTVCVCQEIISN